MNCTYPLEESILMDFVPKSRRARWKSLDSIGIFGWCGSAALGGYLADVNGYAFTFLITAGVQYFATILQGLLIFLVPRSEARVSLRSRIPSQITTASTIEPLSASDLPEASRLAEPEAEVRS